MVLCTLGQMDIGVPHMAGCAEDKVANAKLLKVKKSFFMEIASSKWVYRFGFVLNCSSKC